MIDKYMLAALPADPTNFSGGSIGDIINAILPYVFGLAGFAVLFYLISGGYQYMMSKGDPKSIAQAQQTITYAIIGFIVLAGAYLITSFAGTTLGLDRITEIFN